MASPNDELDLPPGSPAYAAGPLSNPSVGAFRASGQTDVTKFLSPSPTPIPPPPPPPSPTPTPASQTDSWMTRARDGIMTLISAATPSPTPATVAPTAGRSAVLEKNLDDLERRSTVVSPVYQRRLQEYSAANPAQK